ncbi:RNA-directed DNA polymerase [Paradesulfitobacterium aromaticivorans]
MRTHKNLYPAIYDFENLYYAYLKARSGHRFDKDVLIFSDSLESNLIQLQNEIIWKTHRTGPYRCFYVHEPKTRLVAALPFRDRVLQHALCAVIEPLFEKQFIYDNYACRVGKGTHAGVDRLTKFLIEAHWKWENPYCLKVDVKQFFPSIWHDKLINIIKKTVGCEDTLWLIVEIVNSWPGTEDTDPRGLPIGNLTSQLFANVYMNELDHYVKESLRVRYYVRYMDDFVILSDKKDELWYLKREIEDFLNHRLGLSMNGKTGIFPTTQGVDFLGYRVWPTHKLLRKRSMKRIRRALKKFQKEYRQGTVGLDKIHATISSWLGHASHADSYHFTQKLFQETVFIHTRTSDAKNTKMPVEAMAQTGEANE